MSTKGSSFQRLEVLEPDFSKRTDRKAIIDSASIGFADLDNDGLLDFTVNVGYLASSYLNKSNMYFAAGDVQRGIGFKISKNYEKSDLRVKLLDKQKSERKKVLTGLAYFNIDDYKSYLLSFLTSRSFSRLARSCEQNWELGIGFDNTYNAFESYKDLGDGRLLNVSSKLNLDIYQGGVTGVSVFDYNSDGLQDIYVGRGVWSSGKESINIFDYLFYLGQGTLLKNWFYDPTSQGNIIYEGLSGDINFDIKNNYIKGRSLEGNLRNRLYLNLGNNRYVDVAYLEGVDSRADSRLVEWRDINGDSYPDLILVNAPSVSERARFPLVEIYKNLNGD